MSTSSPRRRFQYSLRTLFLFVTITGCLAGRIGWELRELAAEREAEEFLKKYELLVATFNDTNEFPTLHLEPSPRRWFINLFGFRSLHTVAAVGFTVGDYDGYDPITNVNDAVVDRLAVFRDLKSLGLTRSKITSQALRHLPAWPRLRYLSLTDTAVNDDVTRYFLAHENLCDLHLAKTRITDIGLKNIATLHQLRELDLQSVPLSGSTIAELANCPRLNTFCAEIAQPRQADMAWLKYARELTTLNLRLGQPVDLDLADLQKLRFVQLAGVRSVTLANSPALKSVNLRPADQSNLTLRQLPALTELDISSPAGQCHLQLKESPALTTLNIHSECRIIDVADVGRLTALTTLTLDKVPTTGPLLEEIAKCQSLRTVTLGPLSASANKLALLNRLELLTDLGLHNVNLDRTTAAQLTLPPNLTRLGVHRATGNGWSDFRWSQHRQLTTLSFTEARLPSLEFVSLPYVTHIGLSHCELMSLVLRDLPNCEHFDASSLASHNLEFNDLPKMRWCHLSVRQPRHDCRALFKKLPAMLNFSLIGINDTGSIDDRAAWSTNIRDEAFPDLETWNQLESLELRGAAITDKTLQRLSGFRRLSTLDITECPVSNACLPYLSNCTNLIFFTARDTRINSAGVAMLRRSLNKLSGPVISP